MGVCAHVYQVYLFTVFCFSDLVGHCIYGCPTKKKHANDNKQHFGNYTCSSLLSIISKYQNIHFA